MTAWSRIQVIEVAGAFPPQVQLAKGTACDHVVGVLLHDGGVPNPALQGMFVIVRIDHPQQAMVVSGKTIARPVAQQGIGQFAAEAAQGLLAD